MIKNKLDSVYDDNFYLGHIEGMVSSAKVILDILNQVYKYRSVIDIGCGRGAWLSVSEEYGATILKGFDGDWIKKDKLLSKNIDFSPVDFEKEIPRISEKYDLCISLEVAEHLSESKAEKFINTLCGVSEVVLFSAAVKYQGGTNHVNEQWQSYWVELFKSNGYECADIFRNKIWNNNAVEWWYKQNIFLFISNKSELKLKEINKLDMHLLDVVHPINYTKKIENFRNKIENPSLSFCIQCFKRLIKSKITGT